MNATATVNKSKGGVDITITCDRCGGPIVGSDALGMHCAKRCYDKENKEAKKTIANLMNEMKKLMPDL